MHDFPPLPSSGAPSPAPSRQSSSPELTESHLYIRDFVRETRQRLNFSSVQLPILDDRQLADLSDGETILVHLSCSSLNALASMTRHLDTITTQLGTLQGIVATLPTTAALDSKLSPIQASLRDLSQRVSAAPPPQAPAPARPPVPPTGATTHPAPSSVRPPIPPTGAATRPAPLPAQPRAEVRAPPPSKASSSSFDPTSPGMTRTPEPFTATLAPTPTSSLTPGKQTRSVKGSTPTPPPSSRATSPLTVTSPNPRMPWPPRKVPRRARRIRAPSRPPKSRQPVTLPLRFRHQGLFLRPKECSTLLVLRPLSTRKRPSSQRPSLT